MQHRRRVRGVAYHDEIGIVGHLRAGQAERPIEHDVVHADTGRPQRHRRLGERRRDHRRQRRAQVGKQRESLGGPGQQRDLVALTAVTVRDGLYRRALVVCAGVMRQIRQPCGQPLHQPGRRLRVTDVNGEIEHARFGGLIAVVARRRERSRRARIQTRHV